MKIDNLRAFITVANTENMTQAAEQMFMSQQNLSQIIKRMEEELGVNLFNRNAKSISLTKDGRDFFDISNQMLLLYDDFIKQHKASEKKYFFYIYTTPACANIFSSIQMQLADMNIYISVNRKSYYELHELCERNVPGFFMIPVYSGANYSSSIYERTDCWMKKNENSVTICHAKSSIAKKSSNLDIKSCNEVYMHDTVFLSSEKQNLFFTEDINQIKEILRKENYIFNLPEVSYKKFFTEPDEWVVLNEQDFYVDYRLYFNKADSMDDFDVEDFIALLRRLLN